MDSGILRRNAEQYIETQLATLAECGSPVTISSEAREDLVSSAMRAAGYRDGMEGAE